MFEDTQSMSHPQDVSVDFFDLLPDDLVIAEILPRIDTMKSIARLSMTSRRLRHLCHFAPIVDFGNDRFTDQMANYLDKFLAFHITSDPKYFQLQRLCIKNIVGHQEQTKRVKDALSLNLQQLILESNPSFHNIIKLPFHPLKHLIVLKLELMVLEENFGDWISNCCVALEQLTLSWIHIGNSCREIRLRSSSLRVLGFVAHYDPQGCYSLDVSAPKLVTLVVRWMRYYPGHHISLRVSAPSLKIFFLLNSDVPITLDYFSSNNERNFPSLQLASLMFFHTVDLESLRRIFRDISQTKSLDVTTSVIQQLSIILEESYFPSSLSNLRELYISASMSSFSSPQLEAEISAIISFLRKIPSLKKLRIAIRRNPCDQLLLGQQISKMMELIRSIVDNIQEYGISKPAIPLDDNTTKIELIKGENGIKLVEDILKYAPSYKKYIISYSL